MSETIATEYQFRVGEHVQVGTSYLTVVSFDPLAHYVSMWSEDARKIFFLLTELYTVTPSDGEVITRMRMTDTSDGMDFMATTDDC